MRFFNILRYDLRMGFLRRPLRWIATAVLFSLLAGNFCLIAFSAYYQEFDYNPAGLLQLGTLPISIGDEILIELGSVLPPSIQEDQAFSFPTIWLFTHLLVCFFTLGYMNEDLTRGGVQVLIRTRRKSTWWLAKCAWNILVVTLYYGLGEALLWMLGRAVGFSGDFTLNPFLFQTLTNRAYVPTGAGEWDFFVAFLVMPCLTGIAINLMQMTLTLFVKPMVAFIAVAIYLSAAVFYPHPLLLANYAMPVRSAAAGIYAFWPSTGILLCAAFSLASVAVGAVYLRKMDILPASS